jgi:serine-type D-Ala-D-Ala carboxypeptidase/endopeptidase
MRTRTRPEAFFAAAALAVALCAPVASAAAQSAFVPDSDIQAIIDARVRDGRVAGIVVGLLEPDGSTRVLTAGTAGTGRSLGAESVFEIGSITKVFTGVLLADMARTGDISPNDPIARYLPADARVPSRDGVDITLAHLSEQTSGLPRLPGNMRPRSMLDPYADYSIDQLYDFLRAHTLRRVPGAQYEYSNVGVGLLGHVLALRAGTSYEELVRTRILEPLGMHHTFITVPPAQRALVVAGHNAQGDTVPPWHLPTLAGAGALRSTTVDMLRFASAAVRDTTPLGASIRLAMQPRVQTGNPSSMIGLGWHRLDSNGDTLVLHNGGTGGFRTFLGIGAADGRAVVLLTNSGGGGSDDIALHLLDPRRPLARRQP